MCDASEDGGGVATAVGIDPFLDLDGFVFKGASHSYDKILEDSHGG